MEEHKVVTYEDTQEILSVIQMYQDHAVEVHLDQLDPMTRKINDKLQEAIKELETEIGDENGICLMAFVSCAINAVMSFVRAQIKENPGIKSLAKINLMLRGGIESLDEEVKPEDTVN